MRWFRLYTEFATDAKVQSLPEAMQRRLIMLFCLQSTGELATLDDALLAFALRITAEELEETRARFEAMRFINRGSWTPRNWDKRQPRSDDSKPRVRKHRNGGVTGMKRNGNGDVTASSRPCNATEENREEERREEREVTHTDVCVKSEDTHTGEPPLQHPDNRIIEGPPEWQAVIAKAKQLWHHPMARFPEKLREAWGTNGALDHWWEHADPEAFVDALVDLAAKPSNEWTVDRFLSFVRGAMNRRKGSHALRLTLAAQPSREMTPEEIAAEDARLAARAAAIEERRNRKAGVA